MWGESSKECELNCQCSGLITDSFKINSGNNATKRRHEEAIALNYKYKMNPYPLNFDKPLSPLCNSPGTPKRRVLGEIQNSPLAKVIKHSPLERNINQNSPITTKLRTNTSKITRIFEERTKFRMSNKENHTLYEREMYLKMDLEDCDTTDSVLCDDGVGFDSPLSRGVQNKSNNNWTLAKLSATPNMETPMKIIEDTSRDSGYSNSAQKLDLFMDDRTIDFSQIIASTSYTKSEKVYVPENDVIETDTDFETLHDLEQEFDSENFDECSKYEIISTDSPNIISRGSTSRKITSKNFVFGAPIADSEKSTSFNKPNVNATRMLNFDEENFEFTSPVQRPKVQSYAVKKSLKFNIKEENLNIIPITRDRSDSSIGSMMESPVSTKSLYPSGSTHSMESGFISEIEDTILDLEEASNSPKLPNFTNLLSGQIKNTLIKDETVGNTRPTLNRSVSYNPDICKAKTSLFSIQSPGAEKRAYYKVESKDEDAEIKRRRGNCGLLEQKMKRPVLQRAFSENAASIMSALAKSASNPDLIGDFTLPFALPLTPGPHKDLKSISCDTLADLLKGHFNEAIHDFQVIDCRYPYEYSGGHIRGSRNMHTPEQILTLMGRQPTPRLADHKGRSILVFHCEFSQERGPKLSRFLRSSDRALNKESYPHLQYPEMYLLHEGYKAFYQSHPEHCEPEGYTSMLDPKYKKDLQTFRADGVGLKKSLSMDERKKKTRSRLLL